MYRSLEKAEPSAQLFILCMDETTYNVLKALNLKNARLIKLSDIENPKLKMAKSNRSFVEYCWTLTPALIKYCIETYQLSICTYIDADTYFFNSPQILIQELEHDNSSILLTGHNYTAKYNRARTAGRYCVQFNSFRNDDYGRKALNWWYDRCLEWCYAREEDGKFGDQKYLDDWTERFDKVRVLQNFGAGVAPWNVQQFEVSLSQEGQPQINGRPIVFYHFHNLKYLGERKFDFCRSFYDLSADTIKNIYIPYAQAFLRSLEELKSIDPNNVYDISYFSTWKNTLLSIVRKLRGTYYVMEI